LPTMRASGLPCTAVGHDVDMVVAHRRDIERPAPDAATAPGPPLPPADRAFRHLVRDLDTAGRAHDRDGLRVIEAEARSLFDLLWAASAAPKPSRLGAYGEVADAMVDDLLALARSWRPDLVVYDALTFAGPLVARLIGVPAVRSLFGPDVTYFVKTPGETAMSAVLDRLGPVDLDLLGTATVDPCPPSLQLPDEVAPARRVRIRYVPYNGLPEVPAWLPDLAGRERICLTWGTSTDRLLGERAFLPDDVLSGCAKLAADRDAELVLAITANQRHLIPDPPAGVRIVESVPLDALLPACDVVVHQGGAGTMLTALHHGLPQLVLPQLLDQTANAFHFVATGAGRSRTAPGLAASDLVAAGHDLLDNPAYRTAARDLHREMLALPVPADVVGDLAALT
jgi:hypothetical protein